jgi:hypothetical protein
MPPPVSVTELMAHKYFSHLMSYISPILYKYSCGTHSLRAIHITAKRFTAVPGPPKLLQLCRADTMFRLFGQAS